MLALHLFRLALGGVIAWGAYWLISHCVPPPKPPLKARPHSSRNRRH